MNDPIVDELVAEQEALDGLMAGIDEVAWTTPSTAEGWTTGDEVAHLAIFDEVAFSSLTGVADPFAVLRDQYRDVAAASRSPAGGRSGSEILAWWRSARAAEVDAFRAVDPKARVPWGPNHMAARSLCTARLMETYAHGLDCFAVLGVEPVDTDRLRHVCHIAYRAIPHAFRDAGRAMPGVLDDLVVEVTSPSGELWRYGTSGAPQRIEGTAAEFARVGVRRLEATDAKTLTASGPLAEAALATLKAYL